jgi:beta-glucosidase-like glycosyl hydrolase/CubicO group peptidase (beta-lactamase class C family)
VKKTIYTFPLIIVFTFLNLNFQEATQPPIDKALEQENNWVETTFNNLTLDEKIGQLMWIRAHSDKGPDHVKKVKRLITEYHVGGLTFFQGTPEKQAQLNNEFQALSKIPLIISMDAEWGLGMRLKQSTISFPNMLTLGAIQDNRLLYDMGEEIARQCRRLGVQVNFGPVADVNNNAANPVINYRSFGEDRYNVAAKCYMYAKGMEDHNVLACAKHFPGHGDTDVDSHYDLPLITHDRNRLDSIEMFPFRVLFDQGIGSVMVAHLAIPEIDATKNFPVSLSRKAVTDLLKDNLNYDGLVITDGLGMQGVTKHYGNGEVEARAIAAGNDVLLLPQDVGAAFRQIKTFLRDGKIDEVEFDESVKKNLRYKYRLGLTTPQRVETTNLRADLNTQKAYALKRKLLQHALTVVRNKDEIIPLQDISKTSIAALAIGTPFKPEFQKTLNLYKTIPCWQTGKQMSSATQESYLTKLKNYDKVVISLHGMVQSASKNFGLHQSAIDFINVLNRETEVILVVFGNPYSLKYFDAINNILIGYEPGDMVEDLAAQGLFGAFSMDGRLPVTASLKSKFGTGLKTKSLMRMGFGMPEEVGMSSDSLANIAALTKKVVDSMAAPGGVVLVAKDNKIIYHEAFGKHDYKKGVKTQTTDIFDLASVTKIAATTVAVMKLVDEGKLDLNAPIKNYIPELDTTNKGNVTLLDMMTHHAQLGAWIPFFEETVTSKKKPMYKYYRKERSDDFSIQVANKLWLKNDYQDSIWYKIVNSPLRSQRKYVYSDLGFIITAKIIEKVTEIPIEDYVQTKIYKPLGLQNITYRPLEKFDKKQIPPTDDDRYWRQQKVQGYVHDMAAAMLDGVAGHAGLFATSTDLAVIMQMLLNGGYYGGKQIISTQTVRQFTTRCSDCSRRGIGFDMKEKKQRKSQNMSYLASERTFGHLGFTGICTWADPDQNLVYVFLSNRTFPTWKGRNILGRNNYRPRIQSVIYEAIEE